MSDTAINSSTPWRLLLSAPTAGNHIVQIYKDPFSLEKAVSFFVREGLSKGEPVLVVAIEYHRKTLVRALENQGFRTRPFSETGHLVFMDADALLQEFMQDGAPDWDLFKGRVGGAIERARAAARKSTVRVYSEIVDILSQSGKKAAALRLEDQWNRLIGYHSFPLFCAYFTDHVFSDDSRFLRDVCGRHTHLVSA